MFTLTRYRHHHAKTRTVTPRRARQPTNSRYHITVHALTARTRRLEHETTTLAFQRGLSNAETPPSAGHNTLLGVRARVPARPTSRLTALAESHVCRQVCPLNAQRRTLYSCQHPSCARASLARRRGASLAVAPSRRRGPSGARHVTRCASSSGSGCAPTLRRRPPSCAHSSTTT